jgi:PqqD family protein of HPr-rel-A system
MITHLDAPGSDGRYLTLTPSGKSLIWQDWGDLFIVYQPSSTETHLFNDTTAAVVQSLEKSPLSSAELFSAVSSTLMCTGDALSESDLSFVTDRLEELGLIDWSDQTALDL